MCVVRQKWLSICSLFMNNKPVDTRNPHYSWITSLWIPETLTYKLSLWIPETLAYKFVWNRETLNLLQWPNIACTGKKRVKSIFDSIIDWDHHIWYWTYNILCQIRWSQSIVELKIDLTRFFPSLCWYQSFEPFDLSNQTYHTHSYCGGLVTHEINLSSQVHSDRPL